MLNSRCIIGGEMGNDSCSKVEQKRCRQWVIDAGGPELFSNKKQAIETANSRPVLRGAMDSPLWHNTSHFRSVSGQFNDHLFGPEIVNGMNVFDRNVPSVDGGNMLMGRNNIGQQYAVSASMGLGDVGFSGIRKVKINQFSDNDNPVFLGQSYSSGNSIFVSPGVSSHKSDGHTISLGPTYTNRTENTVSAIPSFGKDYGNFISIGPQGEGKIFSVGHYTKGNERKLTMGLPLVKEETNYMAVASLYGKRDNIFSMAYSYEKKQDSFISMRSAYDRQNGNLISMGPYYVKGDANMIPMGSMCDKPDSNVTSLGSIQDNGNPRVFTFWKNSKLDNNTISFGGFPIEPAVNLLDGIVCGYDVVLGKTRMGKISHVLDQSVWILSNAEPAVNKGRKAYPKTDAMKKVPPNNFPTNVKSLLSTGIFEGIPVKYVSWSREKNLKGIIKGIGYLCGCKECNFSKTLNSFEFERHANCKTKHPNNHIYFNNGKTIYAVVQELRNTPQEMLFDSIQNITGSPIDQENFRIWKASYPTATRELQGFYGKDEVFIPS